ncbi:MAG: serine/threonine protein kinase [Acidobacteria bacterium OLB17]|nr:MAG: serine/threonine protein kinase [Acidobacteria bacterium OLB17]MCZ2391685.1 protein kinase [Acidobacteriota bacterium]
MIEAGKVLQQRYRIDRQIGQGGMGAVYIATDERFSSKVAIKETLYMDDNFRKAIEREARLLNSLKHNALPSVSDHFEENNSQFLVMEYVAGEDLSTIIERDKKPFPFEQVLDWADQLLDALDFLHSQVIPVVHRDIKPQNLKLTPKGKIVLLDFGLAKGNPTDAGHQTAAKSIFGYSRNYASLEQIQGTGTDPRSDLYSLAATLYHLMTGVPPEDALTRAMAVLTRKPDPLKLANAIRPEIPAGVAGVLHSSLALDAAERPASADEMREMLRSYENYAHLAVAAAGATNSPEPTRDVHLQATRLMPEATRPVPLATGARTEVLESADSFETALRPGGLTANSEAPRPKSKKRFAVAAAAVLLGGSALALGGAYVANPTLFGSGPTEPAGDLPSVTANTNAAVPDANANAAVHAEVQPQEAPAVTEERTGPVEKPRTPADPKPQNDPSPDRKAGKVTIKSEDGDITMDDLDDPSEIIITKRNPDGSVTTTKVNPPKRPNTRRYKPNAPEFPFSNGSPSGLTPQQERQLREAWKAKQLELRRNRQRAKEPNQPPAPQ